MAERQDPEEKTRPTKVTGEKPSKARRTAARVTAARPKPKPTRKSPTTRRKPNPAALTTLRLSARGEEILGVLRSTASTGDERHDTPLRLLAVSLELVERYQFLLAVRGAIDHDGRPSPLVRLLEEQLVIAVDLCDRLGLIPAVSTDPEDGVSPLLRALHEQIGDGNE